MKDVLTRDDVVAALYRMADDLTAEAEQLRELDAAIGDGDLGITITLGFQAVRQALPGLAQSDLSAVLMKSGMTFNRQAASTFGALFATMLLRSAQVVKGRDTIGAADLARMLQAAADGVRERGKANLGDKTLLDALVPAAEACTQASVEGATLEQSLARALAAAEQGALATRELKSRSGRASWFAERTVGIQDPGATAVMLMLRSLHAYVAE